MIKYILFIVLLFSSLHLYAQNTTWQQSYELIPGAENDDESRGILVDSTGIYLVTRSYCGDNNNKPCVGIIKLEAESGDVIFKKNYTYIPPTDPLFAGNSRCLIKSLDNNFLLAGTLYLGNDQSTFIMKFDQNGDSLWFKTYQGEGLKLAQALIESPEGDLFFYSGGIDSQNNSLAGITKLDNEGNIIWTQQHDFTDVMINPTGGCIALTNEQEIMLYFSGYAIEPTDNSRYAHLAKFDQMGNLLWVDRLYREDFYYGEVIKKMPDGNFAGSVMIDSVILEPISIENLPMITKFDEDGHILWEFIPPMIGRQFLLSMSVTEEGNILAHGTMWNPENFPENYQGWIAKISSDGELLWQRGYFLDETPAAFFEFRDVDECPDGSLVAVGTTEVVETSNYNAWVVKLDSEGCFDADDCTGYNNLIVGTEEITLAESDNITLAPNPTSDKQFQLLAETVPPNAEIRLYSSLGQLLFTEKWTQSEQVFSLPNGGLFYVVVFSEGRQVAVRKVVAME